MPALEAVLPDTFGDGPLRCRYETWLWQATTRWWASWRGEGRRAAQWASTGLQSDASTGSRSDHAVALSR